MSSTVCWGSGGRPGRFGHVQRLRTILRCQSRTVAGVTSNADQRQRGRRRAAKARNARSAHESADVALTAEHAELVAEHEYLDVLVEGAEAPAPSSSVTRRTSKKRNESATAHAMADASVQVKLAIE